MRLAEYSDETRCLSRHSIDLGSPRPNAGEGSCEKIENRLLPALSVRRSARSTQVERALRARFRLWIQNRDGSRSSQFNFFTASGARGEGASTRLIDPAGLQTLIQRWVPRADPGYRIPPHPQPLSRVGARGAEFTLLPQRTDTHGTCYYNSQSSVRAEYQEQGFPAALLIRSTAVP